MIMVILLVLTFRSSSNLAAAYGISVTGAMAIDAALAGLVAAWLWGWGPLAALVFGGFFLLDHLAPAGSGAEGPEDAQARAEALATVVRRAFEPPGQPDPAALAAAAPLVADLYEQLLAHLVHALPEEEP